MKVAGGDDFVSVGEDERVVGGGVQLDVEDAAHEFDRVVHHAVDLRHAAQRVRVLHAAAVPVRL